MNSSSPIRRESISMRTLGRFWTAANVLSVLRLIATFPLAYLIATQGSDAWIWGLMLFAVLTDFFDGKVARWSGTVSDWGKVLDPLADKVGGGWCCSRVRSSRTPRAFPSGSRSACSRVMRS